VAELYGGNIECFNTPEGQKIRELLLSAGVEITPMIADGLTQRMHQLEQEHGAVNALKNGAWREDHALWAWLAREENLPLVVLHDSIRAKMLILTMNRLTLLTNDVLGNLVSLTTPAIRTYDPKQRYSALRLGHSRRCLQKFVQEQVLQDPRGRELIRDLMRIAQSLSQTADPMLRKHLDDHLAIAVFRECADLTPKA
jgi:hypothetical protein